MPQRNPELVFDTTYIEDFLGGYAEYPTTEGLNAATDLAIKILQETQKLTLEVETIDVSNREAVLGEIALGLVTAKELVDDQFKYFQRLRGAPEDETGREILAKRLEARNA